MSTRNKIIDRDLRRALLFRNLESSTDVFSSKPRRSLLDVAVGILRREVTIEWRSRRDHDIATEVEKHEWD